MSNYKNEKYLQWLHDLTLLGDEKKIAIRSADTQLLELLFKEEKTPQQAIGEITEVLFRIDAINENPE